VVAEHQGTVQVEPRHGTSSARGHHVYKLYSMKSDELISTKDTKIFSSNLPHAKEILYTIYYSKTAIADPSLTGSTTLLDIRYRPAAWRLSRRLDPSFPRYDVKLLVAHCLRGTDLRVLPSKAEID
jgi:hypothetical protein